MSQQAVGVQDEGSAIRPVKIKSIWGLPAYSQYISLRSFLGFPSPLPMAYRPNWLGIRGFLRNFFGRNSAILTPMGHSFGFTEERMQYVLSYHDWRHERWSTVTSIIAFLLYLIVIPLGLIAVVLPLAVYSVLNPTFLSSPSYSIIRPPLLTFTFLLSLTILSRLTFRIVNRRYAETLCIREALFILTDLNEDDVLLRSDKKDILLRRLHSLATLTLLIATRYRVAHANTRKHVEHHFQEIAEYVREHEPWIHTPIETTLNDLRRDFHQLATMYVLGNYGQFTWRHTFPEPETGSAARRTQIVLLLRTLARFTVLTLPLLLMGLYLGNSSLFPWLEIDAGVVGLVFLAWLLLTLDSTFKLGVVSELVGFAKGIKELT
jgi:hypothetical protein